jgi:hypothetical protein
MGYTIITNLSGASKTYPSINISLAILWRFGPEYLNVWGWTLLSSFAITLTCLGLTVTSRPLHTYLIVVFILCCTLDSLC